MVIPEALKTVGLSEKEAAVYMAALELGQANVASIAKKAGVKRPTTYLVLESLRNRGLINTTTKGRRILYGAEQPSKLSGMIAEKQRALTTILPYLEGIAARDGKKPVMRFYEGREGILRIYDEVFASKEIRFWGSIETMAQSGYGDLPERFSKIANARKTKTFDLLTDTPADRAYAKKVIRPGYEVRFFPKDLSITVDSALFENKLELSAFEPEPHGFIIESDAIVRSFRSLWELAWRGATPYKTTKQKNG